MYSFRPIIIMNNQESGSPQIMENGKPKYIHISHFHILLFLTQGATSDGWVFAFQG